MEGELVSPSVEKYLESLVPARPPEMLAMEAHAEETDFPIIGPTCGYLCYQLARISGARTIFELGSGYGYSTAWFAWAVQENGGGTVHHVVWDEDLSQRARKHLDTLGYQGIVEYHVAEAIETLSGMQGPFDLIFNDIDKTGYPKSLPVIEQKLKSKGLLIIDNMLWSGRVYDRDDDSPDTLAIREFTEEITSNPAWIVSLFPSRDGMIVAYKK